MRVGVIALLQESNTFLTGKTELRHFEQDLLAEGDEVRRRMGDAHHEVGGFFQGLDEERVEVVPVFAARALPFGTVTAATYRALLARMTGVLRQAGRLDGLLVAPHGATVSEGVPDVDGDWLRTLRDIVGPGLPIIGTLDLHANVSAQMVRACDALIAYRTNPHLDQRQRGIDAARLMARTLRGDVRPTMAASLLPMAVNIEKQHTAEPPCRALYGFADRMAERPGVLSNSLLLGFPYADVAEMGTTAIVVTDNDPARAGELVRELAGHWWERRREFVGELLSVDDAVRRAATAEGPACLLDMGDNVGGGSPGDGTVIAHALVRHRVAPAFVCLADLEAVRQAQAAGVGNRARLRVGGKADDRHGPPLEDEFRVVGLYDGRFEETEARHGGIKSFDQGPTAVVETDAGLAVMLTTRRMVPFSIHQLTSCGIDPARFRAVVAKGVNAPIAAYAPVCPTLLRVNTPGVTSADLASFDYRHRRRPMFPLEPDMEWTPTAVFGAGIPSPRS